MNIHVSNLGTQVTEDSLNATFSAYGIVESVTIVTDQFNGKPKGFAFVEMPLETEAITAIEKLNNAVVNGLHLSVKEEQVVSTNAVHN